MPKTIKIAFKSPIIRMRTDMKDLREIDSWMQHIWLKVIKKEYDSSRILKIQLAFNGLLSLKNNQGHFTICEMRGGDMQTHLKVVYELVRRIVEEAHPLRIIFFGSTARGEVGPNSDTDLLVVMRQGVHRRRITQLLYYNITGVGAPFDIVVATPEDLEKHKNKIGLTYRTILQEGREIYAA